MTKQELESCINEYGKEIYSFCRQLTNNQQEADDLYQDTFLKAVEKKDKIDSKDNYKSYLLSIALRLWKNKKRKFVWRKRIADTQYTVEEKDIGIDVSERMYVEKAILCKEREMAVRVAMNKLPDKLKVVVLLFYMEDLPTNQIALILKIPVGTVLSRLCRARKLLRKELEDDFYGTGI